MKPINAEPRLLKQANMTLIRKYIREHMTATRAELAAATHVSPTTIRTLLGEMQANGELESVGYDASSGGRKAERYRFRHGRYYGAAFFYRADALRYLLVNVCGEIEDEQEFAVEGGRYFQKMTEILDDLRKEKTLRSIGVGVPGVVDRGAYRKKNELTGELDRFDLGDRLALRYELPVVLENNVNATAIGYWRRHPEYAAESSEAAYLQFARSCIEAGFLANGRILRGSGNFAGELGLVPLEDGRLLHEHIGENLDDATYVELLTRVLGWIYGVLNPRYIVLGGRDFRPGCIAEIERRLAAVFPAAMGARILYSPDPDGDYAEGMASLTAARMFDEIQFVRE